jgi:hypothetical protein
MGYTLPRVHKILPSGGHGVVLVKLVVRVRRHDGVPDAC